MTRGSEAEQRGQINSFMNSLLAKSTDILTVNAGTKVTAIPLKVESDALSKVHDFIENHIITNIGVTKSMMMRELNMNRDIATVQEIAFINYTRKQDEQLIASAYENQLLNPLLAHLAGTVVSELPFKIKIVRKEAKTVEPKQDENKNVTDQENLQAKKQDEIQSGTPEQPDAKTPIVGAAEKLQEENITVTKKQIKAIQELTKELKEFNDSA
jgi:hypothetical protein